MDHLDQSGDSNSRITQELAEIWKRALNLHDVGPHDSFLSLGGDSLDGMHILMDVEERFGVTLSNSALFEYPTIAKLAGAIRGLSTENHSTWTSQSTRKAA